MDPQRYEQIHRIFDRARAVTGSERQRVLDEACGDDQELRAEVEALIYYDDEGVSDADLAKVTTGEQAGQQIGRYKLLEQIGEGGFGTVWMAEQREPVHRRVALKLIKLGMDTKQVIARFEAERQALAMMEHPGIAAVLDAGATDSGRPYFVMELVRGSPITEYCDRKKVEIRERLELVVQVCEALEHAHQKGVIHRDIKPSNVLVTTIGDRPLPKIIDFGIAKATTRQLTEKTLFTEFRQMIGTPEYMSPEQASETGEDADTRTDVYSTGVLLYELITGATPFDAQALRTAAFGELQRIIREVDPPKPSTRISENAFALSSVAERRRAEPQKLGMMVRGELDWIVMKALEKDRSRRYESSGSMARDIRRYLAGDAIEAAPPSRVYKLRKFIHRNSRTVLAASLLAVALIAGLVGTSLGFMDATAGRIEAQNQRDIAIKEKNRADDEASNARAAEARANRNAYTANMLSACDALDDSQLMKAQSFLDAAPESLRGWEWHMVKSRLDISMRTLTGELTNAPTRTSGMFMHPDGRSFFTVARQDRVPAQQWDLATGQLLAEFAHPGGTRQEERSHTHFTIAPDGSRLFGTTRPNKTTPMHVSTWDLASGDRIQRLAPTPNPDQVAAEDASSAWAGAQPIAIPDGKRLALVRGRSIWMQDLATGKVLARAELHLDPTPIVCNHDGSLIAVGSGSGGLELLDTQNLQSTMLVGHGNLISSFDFSRDGRWLATSSLDSSARIWDLQATPPTAVVLEHPQSVGTIRFSPDARLVTTACGDGALRVYKTGATNPQLVIPETNLQLGSLMWLPDSNTFAVRKNDGSVKFWNVTAPATVRLNGHKGLITGAAFAPAAGLIVSTGWDGWSSLPGCIRFWDAESGDPVTTIGRPGEIARYLTVSRDGRHAAALLSPRKTPTKPAIPPRNGVVIINLETGSIYQTNELSTSMAFSPDGALLAAGTFNALKVRRVDDGSVVRSRTNGFAGQLVEGVSWSGDGRLLTCTSKGPDGKHVHEVLDATTLATIRSFDYPVRFFPDGKRVITGQSTGYMMVLDTVTWQLKGTTDVYAPGRNDIQFSPDGARFATRSSEITVWDAKTFDRVASFTKPQYLAMVGWSHDSKRLIAAWDSSVYVWDNTPLRVRIATRKDNREALATIEPMLDRLFAETNDAAAVLTRVQADASLSARQRTVARQQVLKRALAEQ